MPSTEPSTESLSKKPAWWKRAFLFGFSFGAGLVVVGALVILSINWYRNRPQPARNWPDTVIEHQKIKASLVTRWRGGVMYQFTVSPQSEVDVEAFDKASKLLKGPPEVTILLYDASGFELCSIGLGEGRVIKQVDENGRNASLNADGTDYGCSDKDYSEVGKWSLSWKNLPDLSPFISSAASPSPKSSAPAPPQAALPRGTPSAGSPGSKRQDENTETPDAVEKTSGNETLTGVDAITGRLDTKSYSFLVYRSGERNTIILWEAKHRLRYECKAEADCLVVNVTRDETVHARIVK